MAPHWILITPSSISQLTVTWLECVAYGSFTELCTPSAQLWEHHLIHAGVQLLMVSMLWGQPFLVSPINSMVFQVGLWGNRTSVYPVDGALKGGDRRLFISPQGECFGNAMAPSPNYFSFSALSPFVGGRVVFQKGASTVALSNMMG